MPALVVSPATALVLRRLMRTSLAGDQGKQIGGEVSRLPIFVRCTSITPAGTGVGAECYPAVVVDPDSSELVADQPELGEMWLTVISGGVAATPAVDTIYAGLLAGVFDPDPGGTSDPRPRVFAMGAGVSLASGSASLGSDATIGATQIDTGLFLTLPSAGTYLLTGVVRAVARVSVMGGTAVNEIAVHLRRGTLSGGDVIATSTVVSVPLISQDVAQTAPLMCLETTTGSQVVTLWASRFGAGTWTTSYIDGGSNETTIGYVKIA